MKTSSFAVETSRSISQSNSIVRQTNKRSFLTTVLFRTTFTRTIILRLLSSNISQEWRCWLAINVKLKFKLLNHYNICQSKNGLILFCIIFLSIFFEMKRCWDHYFDGPNQRCCEIQDFSIILFQEELPMVGLLAVTKKGAVKLLFSKFLQVAVRDRIGGCRPKPLEMYWHMVKRRVWSHLILFHYRSFVFKILHLFCISTFSFKVHLHSSTSLLLNICWVDLMRCWNCWHSTSHIS